MAKTWFVTGASRGLGRAIAEAALERGDNVAAAARNLTSLADLQSRYTSAVLPLSLDVRQRSAVHLAVEAAQARFGRLDLVVNNAARGLTAAVEEASEAEIRDVIETNLLGTIWVTQAAMPILRAQGSGHLVQISSGAGVISWPTNGIYQASKFGVEGMSEAVAQEARHLGIKVTIVQVGHMDTEFGQSSVPDGPLLDAYLPLRSQLTAVTGYKGRNPNELAAQLLKIADERDPPLRVLLGRSITDIEKVYKERLATWSKWSDLLTS